jgi:hypothetical protein
MAHHKFWIDRDDFAAAIPALADVLGCTLAPGYDIEKQLDRTSSTEHLWFLLIDHESANLRISLAIDDCGVTFDITCPNEKFPEVVSLMTKFNPYIAKIKMCSQCGHVLQIQPSRARRAERSGKTNLKLPSPLPNR